MHSWISHCTLFRLKHRASMFREKLFPRKKMLQKKNSKNNCRSQNQHHQIYPFVPSFISNKALWSSETKFAKKKVFWERNLKNNCQIQNKNPWIPLRTELHSKKSTLKFRDQVIPQRYLRDAVQKNYSWTQNQLPGIPLFAGFHFKQSALKFQDQICPKNVL